MNIRRIRRVEGVADPVGPFSPAVVAGGLVFTTGQLPSDAAGSIPEEFEAQVEQTLQNLAAVLAAAGTDLAHVVKVNGYLAEPWMLETYNAVYLRHFGDVLPARTTVCVSLWGVALEIDCVAALPEASA